MAEGIRIEDGEITGIEDSNSNNRKGKLRDTIRDSCTVTFLTVWTLSYMDESICILFIIAANQD